MVERVTFYSSALFLSYLNCKMQPQLLRVVLLSFALFLTSTSAAPFSKSELYYVRVVIYDSPNDTLLP